VRYYTRDRLHTQLCSPYFNLIAVLAGAWPVPVAVRDLPQEE
jgi:hypothetical protein